MRAVNLIPAADRHGGSLRLSAMSPLTMSLIGALLAGLIAVTALVLVGNVASDRRSELADVQAQTAQTQAKADALAGDITTLKSRERSAAAVRGLVGTRYDWPRLFADISGSLPGDVKLTSINGVLGAPASSAAAAPAGGTTSTASGASLQLAGCAGSLRSVASAIQRMRRVSGVQDVTLGSSSRGSTDTAGAGCPHPRSFNLTVSLAGPASAVPGGA